MEAAVRKSGLPFVILQPSVLFGDRAEFVAALARLARRLPVLPAIGGGTTRFQPLWIDDLASCLVKALSDDSVLGRAIAIGGSEYATFKEVLQAIAQAMGKRRLILPLPLPIARLQAATLTALLPRPPLTPATLELFSFDNSTSLDAVEQNFGFKPRGFREHLLAHGLEG
jgi:NADH dehydrogenase